MASRGSFRLSVAICCMLYVLPVLEALTDGEDYVPNFFSGRRQDGEHAGIDPPPIVSFKQRALITNVKTMKFTQKLDHFNSTCQKSWTQRYLLNDKHFNPNRSRPVIFIRVGGENSVNETDLLYGHMVRLAKRHRALLLELEHRYYGESKPTKNLKVENLFFLSHSQALMDLETFIWNQKRPFLNNDQFPSVILYGCSYAGSLAALHRVRYARSTLGALSVCAPMTAEAAGHGERGYRTPKPLGPVDVRRLEYQTFYYELSYRMLQAAQYNRIGLGEQSELGVFCQTMNDQSIGDPAERYVVWLNSTGRKCLKHDGLSILSRNVYWNSTLAKTGTRQWLYQMCTEFGYFSGFLRVWKEVTNFRKGLASMDVEIVLKICNDSFGIIDTVTVRIPKTKLMFYQSMREASNIVFIQGQMDPWRDLGVNDYRLRTEYSDYQLLVNCVDRGTSLVNFSAELGREASAEERRAIRDLVFKFPANASHCEEPSGDQSLYPDLVEAYEAAEAQITTWISGPWKETFKKPINMVGFRMVNDS